MTENKLNYKEAEDGLLYPEIVVSEEYSGLGKYGRLAMKYMEEQDIIRYNTLLMSGKLIPMMVNLNQQAMNRLDLIMEQLLTITLKIENPLDTMEAYTKRVQAREIAEEIVLKEIVYGEI